MSKDKALSFPQQLFAGGVAGIAELVVMYPLDVVKTRVMASTQRPTENMFVLLGRSIQQERMRIYRGMTSPLLVEAPKRALKFSSNAQYKKIFPATQTGAMLAGVCAGLTEAIIICPPELVKVRLQIPENRALYSGTFDAFRKIAQQGGITALFEGLESTLWRNGIWNGGYFGSIFFIKSHLPAAQSQSGEAVRNFAAGTLAGIVGTTLNTPADVVKTRVQNQRATLKAGQVPKYSWFIPSAALIAREEGLRALWRGFMPKVVRLGPGGGIMLMVYDRVVDMLVAFNASRK